jgi:RNA polymerase sigma factor (sigma-70 family)
MRAAVSRRLEERSDPELLQAFLSHHAEDAFTALVARYSGLVLGVCRRVLRNAHDAEDAAQATFLVLARDAAHVRQADTLPAWLYGTARRICLQASRAAGRRRRHEGHVRCAGVVDPVAQVMWDELQAVLDAEVQRLPRAQRSAFVLCCFEGLSHAQAARRLGIREGAVSTRLTRARQRLHRRLQRRGIELSTLLAAVAVSSAARAALSGVARVALCRAVRAFGAERSAAATGLSAKFPRPFSGVLDTACGKCGKLTALCLLTACIIGGAVLVDTRRPAPPPAAQAAADSMKKPAPAPTAFSDAKAAGQVEVKGRVLGPHGEPVAGASLLLLGTAGEPIDLGNSGPDGLFCVRIPGQRSDHHLIARAPGAGMDFIDLDGLNTTRRVELHLVKDQEIRGRVLSTEGKPVPGVRVTAHHVSVYAGNSLDPFLAQWKKQTFVHGVPRGEKALWKEAAAILVATTDAAGRFVIDGAGVERLVTLRLSGAGIADLELLVANRAGFDPRPYNESALRTVPKQFERMAWGWSLHGPQLSVIIEAEKPIRGVVTAADTGRPRPGVEVWLTREGEELLPVLVKARTDAHGHYEIHGARKAKSYMLELLSDPATGYMACQVRAADTAGYQSITVDIRVARGVIVTGRVIDRSAGKPVPGFAIAEVLAGNPFVKSFPDFSLSAWFRTEPTADDGTFRVVTLPGPVVLMGGPDYRRLPGGVVESMKYKPAEPDLKYSRYFHRFPDHTAYMTAGGGWNPLQGNFCKVLQIKPGTDLVHEDITVEQLAGLPVRIQDAEGRPLRGVWATGIALENSWRPEKIPGDSCQAYGVEPGKPRLMVFYEPTRRLFGTLRLKGDEAGPVAARLRAGGRLTGRLVNADGRPLAGVRVDVHYLEREAAEVHEHVHRANQALTDDRGRFVLDELVPGTEFRLTYWQGRQESGSARHPAKKALRVKAGETLNLSELKVQSAVEDAGG